MAMIYYIYYSTHLKITIMNCTSYEPDDISCNSDPACTWVEPDPTASPPADGQCLCADGFGSHNQDSTDCTPCEND